MLFKCDAQQTSNIFDIVFVRKIRMIILIYKNNNNDNKLTYLSRVNN